jgi:ADP-ribose pyrophosphatase YjhB (NUDIX family)
VTGSFTPVTDLPDDLLYARCLDTLVKACNDLMLFHRGKVFLGKRKMYPQRDWWLACGGRMRPGESVFDATSRLLRRELQLDLSLEQVRLRTHTVGHYSFVWGKREQLPQTNGTADISVVVALELTDEEAALVAARAHEEYGEAHQWVAPNDVLDPAADYHPALVRSMQDYIKLKRFQQLDALLLDDGGSGVGQLVPSVPAHPLPPHLSSSTATEPVDASQQPLSDAQLLARVREYFAYHRYISAKDTEPVPCKET